MGFDIPEPFCWDESFKVFYEKLDEQHKGLFQGIFDVHADKNNTGKLKTLQDRAKEHFTTEEIMMDKVKFPGLAPHKNAHTEFNKKLAAVKVPVTDDVINFAKDWLVNHIKGVDFKYKDNLQN